MCSQSDDFGGIYVSAGPNKRSLYVYRGDITLVSVADSLSAGEFSLTGAAFNTKYMLKKDREPEPK